MRSPSCAFLLAMASALAGTACAGADRRAPDVLAERVYVPPDAPPHTPTLVAALEQGNGLLALTVDTSIESFGTIARLFPLPICEVRVDARRIPVAAPRDFEYRPVLVPLAPGEHRVRSIALCFLDPTDAGKVVARFDLDVTVRIEPRRVTDLGHLLAETTSAGSPGWALFAADEVARTEAWLETVPEVYSRLESPPVRAAAIRQIDGSVLARLRARIAQRLFAEQPVFSSREQVVLGPLGTAALVDVLDDRVRLRLVDLGTMDPLGSITKGIPTCKRAGSRLACKREEVITVADVDRGTVRRVPTPSGANVTRVRPWGTSGLVGIGSGMVLTPNMGKTWVTRTVRSERKSWEFLEGRAGLYVYSLERWPPEIFFALRDNLEFHRIAPPAQPQGKQPVSDLFETGEFEIVIGPLCGETPSVVRARFGDVPRGQELVWERHAIAGCARCAAHLFQAADGTLVQPCHDREGGFHEVRSADGGRTWSRVAATPIGERKVEVLPWIGKPRFAVADWVDDAARGLQAGRYVFTEQVLDELLARTRSADALPVAPDSVRALLDENDRDYRASLHSLRAEARAALRKHDPALLDVARGLALEPNASTNARLLSIRAAVHLARGDLGAAMSDAEATLRATKGEGETRARAQALAVRCACRAAKDDAAARADCTHALKLDPAQELAKRTLETLRPRGK